MFNLKFNFHSIKAETERFLMLNSVVKCFVFEALLEKVENIKVF